MCNRRVSEMVSETGLSQENESIATGNRTLRKGTDIQEFYRNCNLFVTGGTGFIGKVLIEKLLRSCPAINKIYVVIRPKRSKSPDERKEELIKCSNNTGQSQHGQESNAAGLKSNVQLQNSWTDARLRTLRYGCLMLNGHWFLRNKALSDCTGKNLS
uniref:Fatty acyl-CoA reductase n=1 Tax=Timema douglasi TaxID=61478 RepID=A0A7R8VKQ8_TIMDO|nr:unnamed protein product [Timema douglasi]